jgi:hypothetical protein
MRLVVVPLVPLVCIASSVAADTTVGEAASSRFAPCVAALRVALARRYFVPASQYADEHYCELTTSPDSIGFRCYGTCNDWSCHTDRCVAHDEDLDITLAQQAASPSPWTRDSRYDWKTTWTRAYGATRATFVRYENKERPRVPMSEVRGLLKILDACAD